MSYHHNITKALFNLAKEVMPVRNARIAAAIVYKGRIVAVGVNSYKTHPEAKKLQNDENKPCLHAEMNAIFQAQKDIGDDIKYCDIYVVRAKKINNIWVYGQSKPCFGCTNLIKRVEIDRIYCCTENNKESYIDFINC